jgi:16S rRNA (cytosine967-C5)-methyltransferase
MRNTQKNALNPRARAIQILRTILQEKKSLQECLTMDDTPFVYQLAYGTLRYYYALRAMANFALKQPLAHKDEDIYLLIILGIYQIQHLDVAEYAILKETVDVADKLKKSWAKKLINAILRRFLRERDVFEKQCELSEEARYAHPQWFINEIKVAYPEKWMEILKGNNQKAPMHVRVNALKMSRDEYLSILTKVGIEAEVQITLKNAITLKYPMDVHKLPGFSDGCFSVQDIASQRVVEYLDLQAGQRVLDACAAPGGKTCHILETEPNLASLVAVDVSSDRLQKITENLTRLQLLPEKSTITEISNSAVKVVLLTGDASSPQNWWDKKLFDRILLDAPCSATGVIRRHPDIKLLRTPKDIQKATEKQRIILDALWMLLKPEGRLIYTTCSVLPEENENQVSDFLLNHLDAKILQLHQVLPDELNQSDGFFYAVLSKK